MTNQPIDWNTIKFRASSWGNLLSGPQSKEKKDRGELGITCQKELVKIYKVVNLNEFFLTGYTQLTSILLLFTLRSRKKIAPRRGSKFYSIPVNWLVGHLLALLNGYRMQTVI